MITNEINNLIFEVERKSKDKSSLATPTAVLGALAGAGAGYGATKIDSNTLPLVGAGLGTLGGLALYHKYKNKPREQKIRMPMPYYPPPQYYQPPT